MLRPLIPSPLMFKSIKPLLFYSLLYITTSVTLATSITIGLTSSATAKANKPVTHFTQAELQQFKGHYSTKFGYLFIKAHKKFASVTVDGKYIRLIKKADGRIYPQYKFLGLFPVNLGELSFSLATHRGKRQVVMYSKKRKPRTVGQQFISKPIPKNWLKRLGRYKAKSVAGNAKINAIRLDILNGVLVAYVNNIKYPYPLLATSNTNLYSPSAGHNSNQKIKVSTNKSKMYLEYGKNKLVLTKS